MWTEVRAEAGLSRPPRSGLTLPVIARPPSWTVTRSTPSDDPTAKLILTSRVGSNTQIRRSRLSEPPSSSRSGLNTDRAWCWQCLEENFMTEFCKTWLPLKTDRRAVTAVEYALIVAMIALVIVGSVTAIGQNITTTFNTLAGKI